MSKIRDTLVDSYNEINTMIGDSEEIYDILSTNYYTNSNIDVVIGSFIDDSHVLLDYSTSSDGYLGRASMESLFSLAAKTQSSESESEFKFKTTEGHTGDFTIQRSHDNRTSSDYLDLIGTLNNGHVIVIQTPIESIQKSAMISNTFLAYIGILLTTIGSCVMFIISSNYANPIRKMADIADRMSHLDFNAKVSHFSNDEIGELGQSMNTMSEKLKSTISDLKTANNELRKDIDQKIQIDEMRKEFLSHVSHELKTPIALIQGYAEGLMDNVMDDEESKEFYCEVIMDEASKMNKMVKNLLELNELEFGNNQIQYEHFDLSELINNVVQQSEILIQKNGLDVRVDIEQPLYVWADEYKIERVVTNYFNNAMNHVSESGYIQISMEKRAHDVRIYVYNSGSYISEEELDKLWIKFYKVDKARTREYGGNGIGLSIVAACMAAHGKAYGVENVEDGVRFYFDLDTENDPNTMLVLEQDSEQDSTVIPC